MNCPTSKETFPLGFGLFQVDSGGYALQKLDDIEEIEHYYDLKVEKMFESDDEALTEVKLLANAGNEVCRRAIEFLIFHKEIEVDSKNW